MSYLILFEDKYEIIYYQNQIMSLLLWKIITLQLLESYNVNL